MPCLSLSCDFHFPSGLLLLGWIVQEVWREVSYSGVEAAVRVVS